MQIRYPSILIYLNYNLWKYVIQNNYWGKMLEKLKKEVNTNESIANYILNTILFKKGSPYKNILPYIFHIFTSHWLNFIYFEKFWAPG